MTGTRVKPEKELSRYFQSADGLDDNEDDRKQTMHI